MIGPLITKVVIEVGKALGKAVLAGVGLELARVMGAHVRKRLGPSDDKDDKDAKADADGDRPLSADERIEKLARENERLKLELERLKSGDGSTH